MQDLEEFLMFQDLFNQGLSVSEIAQRTGDVPRTVRKNICYQVYPISRTYQKAELKAAKPRLKETKWRDASRELGR